MLHAIVQFGAAVLEKNIFYVFPYILLCKGKIWQQTDDGHCPMG